MTRDHIMKQINEIFIDTLDNSKIVLTETTQARDITEWDSLMHVLLVDEMENQFKIKFKASEIQSWENIGAIIDSIIHKSQSS